jgi:hypothetical protein
MVMTPVYLRRARYTGSPRPTEPRRSRLWLLALGGVAILLLSGASCPPKPPGPHPTPTPQPGVDYHPELLLTTRAGDFVRVDGASIELRKVISCCEATQGTGWPGLSESFVGFAYTQGRATILQWRHGPFRTCNEPEWSRNGIGGPYVEVDGKADLTRFNPAYWQEVRARHAQAGDLGIVIEDSIHDGWSRKTEVWSSGGAPCAHPWRADGNIQGANHLTAEWTGPLADLVPIAHARKLFEETCEFGNVIYEDGTEPDQVTGARIEYSLGLEALLRQVETEKGCARHLFGTNFKADPAFPYLEANRLQYLNAHDTQPTDSATFWGGGSPRPYVTDEYNPDPAMRPEAVQAFTCYARSHGTYWAAWRHDQDGNAWKASLSLIAQDSCTPALNDGCPYDVAPVASISCKRHSGALFDCTPKGSNGQPIRPEGDITRALCERAALGMGPADVISYSLTAATGTIGVKPRPNVFQYVVTGSGSGTLRCSAPNAPTVDLCRGPVVTQ